MIKDFFVLGLNNLKRRRLRSWLTMIGIFIGIAAVVSLLSLGQGLQEYITEEFVKKNFDIPWCVYDMLGFNTNISPDFILENYNKLMENYELIHPRSEEQKEEVNPVSREEVEALAGEYADTKPLGF